MANDKYNKTFLQAESYEDAQDALQEVYEANPDAIIIVEEEGKECLIEHNKQLNFVPSGTDLSVLKLLASGKEGQVLTMGKNGLEWKDQESGGIAEPPDDGGTYGWCNGEWVEICPAGMLIKVGSGTASASLAGSKDYKEAMDIKDVKDNPDSLDNPENLERLETLENVENNKTDDDEKMDGR